jgi:hypothetical protein
MAAIVEGIYKEGRIELSETPAGLREGRVRVVVISQEQPATTPRYLSFGKYQVGRKSDVDDFRDAEWRGEKEFDDSNGQ